MKFSVKRIFGILTMFAFISAASYQSLCAAEIIHCVPCAEEGHETKAELSCKNCEQSKEIAAVPNPNKIFSSYDLVEFDYTFAEEVVFRIQQPAIHKPQAPPFTVLYGFTENIISITPIRGPSIFA